MINLDQPTCFPDNVRVALSSVDDGTMLDRSIGVHDGTIVSNRTKFCEKAGFGYHDVVYQRIIYGDDQTYSKIAYVNDSDTCKYTSEVQADALVTSTKQVGLMLPVADCVVTVIYDQGRHVLVVAHLGRHSTVAGLMTKSIGEMTADGSDPTDLIVWMSPSAKASHYRMDYFNQLGSADWRDFATKRQDGIYLDLPGYNRAVAVSGGVLEENIHISPINTAESDQYFSHSQGDKAGRFVVLAWLQD